MLYEGINRYRFDQVALEYAQKNYDLFMDDWRSNQHDNEQYYAWGGTGGGDPHYTWGALLCLVPLEQYIDVNPWEGLRFGALNPPEQGDFNRAVWENHTYGVGVGPNRTALASDGHERFEANAGVVVRNYQTSSSQLTFSIHALRPVVAVTQEFDDGVLTLGIDGKPAGKLLVQKGRVSFQVPEGEHTVELASDLQDYARVRPRVSGRARARMPASKNAKPLIPKAEGSPPRAAMAPMAQGRRRSERVRNCRSGPWPKRERTWGKARR